MSLANSDLTDDDGLVQLAGLSKIRLPLDLRAVDIGDRGMAALASLKSLQELNLSDGRFSDKGLVNLAQLPKLQRLEVARVKITDEGIATLAGITSLQALNLDYSGVTDKSLEILKPLENLQELSLDHNVVTDKGVGRAQVDERIAVAQPLPHYGDEGRHGNTPEFPAAMPDRLG